MTAVYVLLWLISSSAWADAVSKIKTYTDPNEYFHEDYACECGPPIPKCTAAQQCAVKEYAGFATLNVSIVSIHTVLTAIFPSKPGFASYHFDIFSPFVPDLFILSGQFSTASSLSSSICLHRHAFLTQSAR